MHYIVFDLEWNIPGRANKVSDEDRQALPFEIIEIGAVKLNESLEIVNKFSVTVRPKLYPILSGHVAAVTRRLQQSMRTGVPFEDAARDFINWCGDDYMLCTWSESDPPVLKQNLAYYGFEEALKAPCLDVQYLFDEVIEQAGIQRSVEYALDFLNIDKSRPFHQAVQDAWYTGRILQAIVEVADEEKTSEQAGLQLDDYAYDPDLVRSYQQKIEPLENVARIQEHLLGTELVCPACGRTLERVIDWEKKGSKLTASFRCPEHGSVSGKTRLRKLPSESFAAYLTMRLDRSRPLTEV